MNSPRNYIAEIKSEKARKLAEDLYRTLDHSLAELQAALVIVEEGNHFGCDAAEIKTAIVAMIKNRKE